MTRSLPSWLTSGSRKLVVLAPDAAEIPEQFESSFCDAESYEELLAGMQRLRGSVYLEDDALRPSDLTHDGRHVSLADRKAWHVLALDPGGRICGCARYLAHGPDAGFSNLVIKNSALARDSHWGGRLRLAVETEMALARERGIAYAELGGWALHKAARCTTEALRIALATYSLSRRLGGCIGISTVTVRNCSSIILQKIGGTILSFAGAAMPLYYDPQYRCEMAMMRFESDQPNPRYEAWVEALRTQFSTVPVICNNSPGAWQTAGAWERFAQPLIACA